MVANTLTIETHCHTEYSHDCLTPIGDLLAHCKAIGIDRLCVTDHNTMRGAFAMAELDPTRVILGEEIKTSEGELLGYFMTEEIPPNLPPMQVIERLKAQGAVISVSHPFDPRRPHWSPETLLTLLPYLDAIETYNSRAFPKSVNLAARTFAQQHQLVGTVGSDAHSLAEVGRSTMTLRAFTTADEFRQALKMAQVVTRPTSGLAFGSTFWAKFRRRLQRLTRS